MFAWFIVCFTLLQSYLCSVFYSPLFIYFIMNIHILRSMALPTFLMCKIFHFMALSDFKQSLIFGNFYDFFVFLWSLYFTLLLTIDTTSPNEKQTLIIFFLIYNLCVRLTKFKLVVSGNGWCSVEFRAFE